MAVLRNIISRLGRVGKAWGMLYSKTLAEYNIKWGARALRCRLKNQPTNKSVKTDEKIQNWVFVVIDFQFSR